MGLWEATSRPSLPRATELLSLRNKRNIGKCRTLKAVRALYPCSTNTTFCGLTFAFWTRKNGHVLSWSYVLEWWRWGDLAGEEVVFNSPQFGLGLGFFYKKKKSKRKKKKKIVFGIFPNYY